MVVAVTQGKLRFEGVSELRVLSFVEPCIFDANLQTRSMEYMK